MSSLNHLRRLYILAEKLHANTGKVLTKEDLITHIQNVTGDRDPISIRTFTRDIRDLRTAPFDLEIDHDITTGYQLKENSGKDFDYRHLIEPFHVFNAFHANADSTNIIFPERYSETGASYLSQVLSAIKSTKRVEFQYEKHGGEPVVRKVEPYAIKQAKGIWYLVGKELPSMEMRTFGLDRFTSFTITNKAFKIDPKVDIKEKFKNSFGIYSSEEYKVETVILEFDKSDGYYLKNMPLHSTQEILEDTDAVFRIKLELRITEDFVMAIMSRSWSLRIVEPLHLRERLAGIYNAAMERNR